MITYVTSLRENAYGTIHTRKDLSSIFIHFTHHIIIIISTTHVSESRIHLIEPRFTRIIIELFKDRKYFVSFMNRNSRRKNGLVVRLNLKTE